MEIPDRIGEIVAYRAWTVRSSNLRAPKLVSLTHRTTWPTGDWFVARCAGRRIRPEEIEVSDATDGRVPHIGCSCGIYAARDREHLVELGFNDYSLRGEPIVIGEVGLAGKVIPGEKAWRAERARPLRLFVGFVHWRLVAPLSAAYSVPVELTNLLSEEGS